MPASDVIVPIGTAVIGALGGYITAAKQAASGRHRIEAENLSLREARGAERFNERRAVYADLVHTSSQLIDAYSRMDSSMREHLLMQLQERVSVVVVNGTDGVRRAAQALYAALREGRAPNDLKRRHEELVEAMRSDVAPRRIE